MILPAGAPGTRSPALSASSAQSCRHRSPGCKKGDETAGRWCCRASQVRDGRAPSFSFGLVADVQYGKKEDKNSVSVVRRYSEAAGKLRLAVEAWKGLIKEGGDLSFVLHLGDIIDGNDSPEQTMEDLEVAAAVFDALEPLPVFHVVGNHCLSVPRETLMARLPTLRDHQRCYYDVPIANGWRLVVLDTTEMSFHSGHPPDSDLGREAQEYYDAHPPELHPQIATYNGGIGSRQLKWLDETLAEADNALGGSEAVIVAAHHPIGSARESHRAWNAGDIERVLLRHPSVKMVLTGHDHLGAYALRGGIHHITLEGLVEAPADSNAFATVHVYPDDIVIDGFGSVKSRVLSI